MSSSSLPIKPAVLVVIIGETVLQDRMIKLLQELGVTGYTLSQAQGAGRHGNRQGDMVGYNTNIEIKTVVSQEVSEAIFSSDRQAMIDFGAAMVLMNYKGVLETIL